MKFANLSKPKGQGVDFVELFFDLVFVFSVTKVVENLHHDVSWSGLGHAILVFWLIWWAWTQFTWSLNASNTEHPFIRIAVLLSTGIAFFMATGVTTAFSAGALNFAIPYVLVKMIGNIILYFVSIEFPAFRKRLRHWVTFSMGGLIAVLLGAILGGQYQLWLWGLAILLDIYTANTTGGGEYEWGFRYAHFAERHGLFVIIALGELLILTGSAFAGLAWTGELVLVVTLSVLLTISLWWLYFGQAKEEMEIALATADGDQQSNVAVESYSLLHFLILTGLIALAASLEIAISHPAQPLHFNQTLLLVVGFILFIAGIAAAIWRANQTVMRTRLLITTAASLAILAARNAQVEVLLGIAILAVLAIGVLEED
jgi:low temperature requirement protein LtrA